VVQSSQIADDGARNVRRGDRAERPASDRAGDRLRCPQKGRCIFYAGSPLVGEAGEASGSPAPGECIPSNLRLRGERHLIVFGQEPGLDRMRARWNGLDEIVDGVADHLDAAAVGAPDGGAFLVRPDGFIGFCATPADANTMAALDAHLSSYLIPGVGA
jgi:hypothetical protein